MTPRLELKLEPEAEAEFLEAAEWYTARSPRLGAAFRDAVSVVLETIEEAPQLMGGSVIRHAPLRGRLQ